MTLKEALQQVNDNSKLIGTKHGKGVIDELVIIPTQGDQLGEIIKQVLWGESYSHLLFGFDDFEIIGLLDFQDYPNSGILLYDSLDNIINKK
jgi:hypothetical protein